MINISFSPNIILGLILIVGVTLLYLLRVVKPEVARDMGLRNLDPKFPRLIRHFYRIQDGYQETSMELNFFRFFMAYDENQGTVDKFRETERIFISDTILSKIYKMKYHIPQTGKMGREITAKFLTLSIQKISKDSLMHILKKRHELRRIMNFRKALKN